MKTAIKELHEKWSNEKEWSWEEIESWFKEAKEKEKEQILAAYNNGSQDMALRDEYNPAEYYNQTYNQNK